MLISMFMQMMCWLNIYANDVLVSMFMQMMCWLIIYANEVLVSMSMQINFLTDLPGIS